MPPQDDAQHAAELPEVGDAFLELDRSWRIVSVNANQERLSGKPREETLGRIFWEVWPEAATEGSLRWREYHRCMDERVAVQFRAHYAPLDLWTGVTAYPISTGGIAIFVRDLTRLRAAEREQRRLAAIVETTDDAIISKDLEGVVQTWNLGAERLFGYTADEMIGRSIGVLLPPERRDEEDQIIAELRAGRRVRHFETTRVRKDGSRVDVSVSVSPLHDEEGAIVGASKIARDISERHRVEQALRQSEERWNAAIEHFSEGAIIATEDEQVVYWNPAARALHGFSSKHEGLGPLARTPETFELWTPDGQHLLALDEWPMRRLKRGEPVHRLELRLRRPDQGWERFVSYSGAMVRTSGGQRLIFLSVTDLTDQRMAELALREADRRKDEFLGMLSHELRNPLAPIRNALYLLDHAEPASPQAHRAREIARRQVGHLTRLVDDLLDVTRIARGKIELRRAYLDLAALTRRTAEDHRAPLRDRGLELEVSVPAAPVPVEGDATRLAQVLGNLLSNAAKFTPAGGRVTLDVQRTGPVAVVHVRDTGVGIAPELLSSVFEPFVQAQQTLARSEGGLGLGLALVKSLTELHGGRVTVTSAPGAGTDFAVELPVARAARATPAAEAPRRTHRTCRVLVVDDNLDAAESLADLVRLFGHEAEVARDGPSAVASVAARRPDVVLCDIGLPGMDGYQVAKALREALDGAIQLVAVSGYARPEDVQRSVEAGFDAHLAKPADPVRLERLLA